MKKKFDKSQRSKTERYKKRIQKPTRKESIHYFFVESKKIPKNFDSWFDDVDLNDIWDIEDNENKSAEEQIFENTVYELINNMENITPTEENPTYYIYGINAIFDGDFYNRDANQVPENEWNVLTNFISCVEINHLRQLTEKYLKPVYPQALICLGVLYESEDREELHRMLYGN